MDPALSKVLRVRGGRGSRSPLYVWMREHHEALRAEFDANGPQWVTRVKAMAEAGLLDQLGKPPTVRGAQQTWYRVCRDVAAGKGAKPGSARPAPARTARPARSGQQGPDPASTPPAPAQPSVLQVIQPQPSPPLPRPAFDPADSPSDDPPKRRFGFAKPRGGSP